MNRKEISEAISLFEHSESVHASTRGPAVVQKLWSLYRQDEIGGYSKRRPKYGRYQKGRPGSDLGINETTYLKIVFPERLGYLSLELVHEGTHAADSFNTVYSELAARMLTILYYRELSGHGVLNTAPVPPRKVAIVRIATNGYFERYQKMSEALRHDRLIDFVLDIDTYADDVDVDWIASNISHWGGLRNRLPVTLGVYLKVLANQPAEDRQRASLILDILDSVSSQDAWTEMIDQADSMDGIRHGLGRVSAHQPWRDRIERLQRRWNVRLH